MNGNPDVVRSTVETAMAGRVCASDRQLGEMWERHFCELAAEYELSFTQQQAGRTGGASWMQFGIHPLLLPDFVIWTAPGEHHEIKHKNPTPGLPAFRSYGLEQYRLEALLAFRQETQQPVLYTIHDWERAGASSSRAAMPNRLEDWVTVNVTALDEYRKVMRLAPTLTPTWVNGTKQLKPCYYWPTTLWGPLEHWWDCPF